MKFSCVGLRNWILNDRKVIVGLKIDGYGVDLKLRETQEAQKTQQLNVLQVEELEIILPRNTIYWPIATIQIFQNNLVKYFTH